MLERLGDDRYRQALKLFVKLPRTLRNRIVRLFHPSYVVSVMAVVVHDERVLVVQHSYNAGMGLPGGLVDRGETFVDAVIREVKEEVGLQIQVDSEMLVMANPDERVVRAVCRASLAHFHTAAHAAPTSPEIERVEWRLAADQNDLSDLTWEANEAVSMLRRSDLI